MFKLSIFILSTIIVLCIVYFFLSHPGTPKIYHCADISTLDVALKNAFDDSRIPDGYFEGNMDKIIKYLIKYGDININCQFIQSSKDIKTTIIPLKNSFGYILISTFDVYNYELTKSKFMAAKSENEIAQLFKTMIPNNAFIFENKFRDPTGIPGWSKKKTVILWRHPLEIKTKNAKSI